MQYISYQPHSYLRPYIDYYWIVRTTRTQTEPRIEKILPITMQNLILYYGDVPGVVAETGEIVYVPRVSIMGHVTRMQNFLMQGDCYLISARFKPFGVYRFFDLNPGDFTDDHTEVYMKNQGLIELYDRLFFIRSYPGKIKFLDNFFLNRLAWFEYKEMKIRSIKYSIEKIYRNNGNVKIHDILFDLNMSERGFRNQFEEYTGLAPKIFSRIIRFNHAYGKLMNNNYNSIHDIIYEAGYYDQAHFINEFKYFTKSTIRNFNPAFEEFDEMHRAKNV